MFSKEFQLRNTEVVENKIKGASSHIPYFGGGVHFKCPKSEEWWVAFCSWVSVFGFVLN